MERDAAEAPSPLRVPAPLSRLPWDLAQDQFGVQGTDFIGIMGRMLLGTRKTSTRRISLILLKILADFPLRTVKTSSGV